ncbi:MAG: UV DNA damage repair endonuclease UvsE [Candidatus Omnitrophica bacterium]|nr:UV DNA damage repair endonuclease UvsE [Candidatus Omnitrophota bacterium]
MIRLGLCCKFQNEPIRFYTATARYTSGLNRLERYNKISQLCLRNALSLLQSIEYCGKNNIGSFRINSQILPLKTHPDLKYNVDSLPDAKEIKKTFSLCRKRAQDLGVRLTFHPDQFILLSSPDPLITKKSIEELDYQAEVSEWVGADVINIHAGGVYGDKKSALERVGRSLSKLNKRIRERLTFENDDRSYTPADLLPFCENYGVPFVYDAHHHRCLPDNLTIEETTTRALKTWNREPLFHISSPKENWQSDNPRWHHDYIDIKDFPECWRGLNITLEVEAKAKELAVKKLWGQLHIKNYQRASSDVNEL